jgi:glycosyltransferase involved in cell wall biosynthesis
MLHKDISVIIPCYREAEVIKNTLLSVYTYLKAHFEHFEIIVVTDGSLDDTKKNAEQLGYAYPEIPLVLISFPKNRGKGAAVREGVLASQYDPVLFIDADLTIPIEEIEKFMSALETADIAIASRLVSGSGFEETIPLHRVIMARGFHLLQILILGNFEFSDTQCGFKLFRRETALELFRKATIQRFAFDAEILFLAQKSAKQVAILPVVVKKDPRNTNVNVFRDPINMFFALLKIRLNQITGRYS